MPSLPTARLRSLDDHSSEMGTGVPHLAADGAGRRDDASTGTGSSSIQAAWRRSRNTGTRTRTGRARCATTSSRMRQMGASVRLMLARSRRREVPASMSADGHRRRARGDQLAARPMAGFGDLAEAAMALPGRAGVRGTQLRQGRGKDFRYIGKGKIPIVRFA